MIHVQVDDFFLLTCPPLPLLAMADSSKPARVAIILECDQWMKRQERAEQRKWAQTTLLALFGPIFIVLLSPASSSIDQVPILLLPVLVC